MKILIPFISGILTVGISVLAATVMRGHNYSDVGVAMYPYSKLAMPAAIVVYFCVTMATFYGLRKLRFLESSTVFSVIHVALLPLDALLIWITVNF